MASQDTGVQGTGVPDTGVPTRGLAARPARAGLRARPSRTAGMKRFVERNPVWALVILIALAFALWLILAPWPAGLEEAIGRKKVFLNAVFNGVTLGGLYFLVASGFTLIFGLMRNVNLAHGSLYLFGGYIGYGCQLATGSWCWASSSPSSSSRGRRADAASGLPPHGGSGPAPDDGDDRPVHRVRRPDAVGVRRRFLPDPDARLAGRAGRTAVRHRRQILRRGGLSDLPEGAAGDLRRLRRHRRRACGSCSIAPASA